MARRWHAPSRGGQPWIDRISDRFFERSFQEAFRRSVEAFRARERLGARAFGSAALGDPDFIEGLLCGGGGGLRLDKVDTVLVFTGEPPLGPLFGCEVDAYLSITGTAAERLGLGAVGDAAFVRRLRAGHAPLLGEVDRGETLDGHALQCRAAPRDCRGDAVPGLVAGGPGRRGAARRIRSVGTRLQRGVRSAQVRGHPPGGGDGGPESANDGILPDHRARPGVFQAGGVGCGMRSAISSSGVRARRRYRTGGAGRVGPRRAMSTPESINAS